MFDLDSIQEELTKEKVKEILVSLGVQEVDFRDTNEGFIMPTYCHNELNEQASHKLYFYEESKLFHCYTECSETFNIFQIVQKISKCTFGEALKFLNASMDFSNAILMPEERMSIPFQIKEKREINYEIKNDNILNLFIKNYAPGWEEEGLTKDILETFNISYCPVRNKIIIPHYDKDNNLIGIRGRALNKIEIDLGQKYMPIIVENVMYNHLLGGNLYGLNLNKENIKSKKKAIIFEGEKSVMKFEDFYGRSNNISVAICGYSISNLQKEDLYSLGVEEIIVALDKQYSDKDTLTKYILKMKEIGDSMKMFCKVSYILDFDALLEHKDSPVDQGKEVFETLYNKRIFL